MVSFIVPVRNDARSLERCLASIRATSTGARAEIIVADNGSSDDSAEVARRSGCAVLVIPGERVAALRNKAALDASGDLLAFVDADHEIAPGWLEAAVELFRDPRVSAAGAPYSSPPHPTWVQMAYDSLRDHRPGTRPVSWLPSGNLAIRRDVFTAVGGFDTALEACEDVDLSRRVRATGGQVVSDDRLRTVHYGDPPTLKQLFASELWRGRNNLQVSLRERLTFKSAFAVGIPVYHMAMLVLTVLALVTGAFQVAAGGAVAFVVGSLPRVFVMRKRRRVALSQALAVALVYDTARALALVVRKRHRRLTVPAHAMQR